MGDLILLRGLPGAGKSTVARLLFGTIFSADDYFYNENGEYSFDAECLGEAHSQCREKVAEALRQGVTPVAVANTLTTDEEIAVYEALARQHCYRLHSLIVENRHGGESVHTVPVETMMAMENRFTLKLK